MIAAPPTTRTVSPETVTPIKPSEAVRLGCLLAPRQITGTRFDGDDGACATGAMFLGGGLGRQPITPAHWVRWPALMGRARHPEPCLTWSSPHKLILVSFLIDHLNDSHRWSRERIADWLEGLGY